jgi:hypothetical protein
LSLAALLSALCAGLSLAAPAAAQVDVSSAPAAVVRRIVFEGNVTDERVLRLKIPLVEGDPLGPDSLQRVRQALYDMRFFKSVDVSSAALEGGAEVRVVVKDGFFVVPFPFVFLGSGGLRGGAYVAARNVFKETENFDAVGMKAQDGFHYGGGAEWRGWSGDFYWQHHDYNEHVYSDGGFTASPGLSAPVDESDPLKFAPVLNSYDKHEQTYNFTSELPLLRGRGDKPLIRLDAGWEYDQIAYSSPQVAVPRDSGRQSEATLGFTFGPNPTDFNDALGSILGYGLADLDTRLRALAVPRWESGAQVDLQRGDSWTASDFAFTRLNANAGTSVSWGMHQRLSLNVGGGEGWGLPFNRLFATGGDTALQGVYAREFRGDEAAGGSLSYAYPFRITRVGVWEGMVFAEGGRTWSNGGDPRDKTGIGATFYYKFWRFPIPIGVSCTYSLDDKDAQISAAVGGRF